MAYVDGFAAAVFGERGAFGLVECLGDDVPDDVVTPFRAAVPCRPDVDPMPFDTARLIHGGFEVIVDV